MDYQPNSQFLVNPYKPNGISTIINWTSPFPFKGLLGGIFHFYSNFKRTLCKQTVETRSAASDLGLHCLPMSHKKDVRLIWFKQQVLMYLQYMVNVCTFSTRTIKGAGVEMSVSSIN